MHEGQSLLMRLRPTCLLAAPVTRDVPQHKRGFFRQVPSIRLSTRWVELIIATVEEMTAPLVSLLSKSQKRGCEDPAAQQGPSVT